MTQAKHFTLHPRVISGIFFLFPSYFFLFMFLQDTTNEVDQILLEKELNMENQNQSLSPEADDGELICCCINDETN